MSILEPQQGAYCSLFVVSGFEKTKFRVLIRGGIMIQDNEKI